MTVLTGHRDSRELADRLRDAHAVTVGPLKRLALHGLQRIAALAGKRAEAAKRRFRDFDVL